MLVETGRARSIEVVKPENHRRRTGGVGNHGHYTDERCSGRVFIGIGIGIGFVIAIALIAMAGSSAHDVDIDPDPDTDPEAVVCCVALRCDLLPCAQLDSKLKIATLGV